MLPWHDVNMTVIYIYISNVWNTVLFRLKIYKVKNLFSSNVNHRGNFCLLHPVIASNKVIYGVLRSRFFTTVESFICNLFGENELYLHSLVFLASTFLEIWWFSLTFFWQSRLMIFLCLLLCCWLFSEPQHTLLFAYYIQAFAACSRFVVSQPVEKGYVALIPFLGRYWVAHCPDYQKLDMKEVS